VDVRFVQADASAPPAELDGAFDIVWATIGVTCWALDLDRWTAAAARMLRPGGRLVLVDLHPAYNMLDSLDPPVADLAWGGGVRLDFEVDSSYDNPDVPIRRTSGTVATWGVADQVGAAIRAGLLVEHLDEHLECEHDPRGMLTPDADGRHRLRLGPGQPPLPMLFTLIAAKSA
jgi:SAM-dependent methyltransferase